MCASHDTFSREDRRVLDAVTLLSTKWSPVLLLVLDSREPLGFNDFLELVPGLSSKVLSTSLNTLQEDGLIDRRVVSESPLRVEYERTEAGRELDQVFDALADWSDSHLDQDDRTIVLTDADPRITTMYEEWLDDQYTVYCANDVDELEDRFHDSVDLVVLTASLPGVDIREFVSDRTCRTLLVVGDQPEPELLSVECDDVLRKPFVRERLLESIADQLECVAQPRVDRERASLRARISFLESIYSKSRLANEDTYDELVARLDALDVGT